MRKDESATEGLARRGFLGGVLSLAATPLAVRPALAQAAPVPAKPIGPAPGLPVQATPAVSPIPAPGGLLERTVELTIEGTGRCSATFVQAPGSARMPGLLVVPDPGGLAAPHARLVRRLAALGYMVLAPNLLGLFGSPDDRAVRARFVGLGAHATAAVLRHAAAWLATQPGCTGSVGVVALGWGGAGLSQLAGDPGPVKAMVLCSLPLPQEHIAGIKVPLQLHYAAVDDRAAPTIEATEKRLMGYSKIYEQFVYEGLTPAFLQESDERRYNEAAASLALERMEFFLARHLKPR
ncbi:dienelactone hydrolase family protein [Prosthecomicrobium sp. N25]